MTVREASADDVAAIREIARAAWETDYPEILSRETAERGVEEWYQSSHIEGEVTGSRTRLFVACVEGVDGDGDEAARGDEDDDERVVGFAHAELGRDDEGYVLRLYVHPDHRNRGLGRRLLERTREDLFVHGAERVNAMVLAANEPGNAFYRSLGFEKVSEDETTIGGEPYRETTYALERDADGGRYGPS
ncbi:MAG: GNAT family N-acetyltransferase [Haloarculaceae archaeon]